MTQNSSSFGGSRLSKILIDPFMNWKAAMGRIAYGPTDGPQGELTMRRLITAFLQDELGATAIEYSIIAAGIGLVIVATVNSIGVSVQTPLTTMQTAIK
jgi:pilus assembly protein Flp/PilA